MIPTDFNVEKIGIKDPFKDSKSVKRDWVKAFKAYFKQYMPVEDKYTQAQIALNLLKLLTFSLYVLIIWLSLQLGFYVFYSANKEMADFKAQITQLVAKTPKTGIILAAPAPSWDSESVKGRDLFAPHVNQAQVAKNAENTAELAYKEFSRDYSIVGIVMGSKPTAIIEEKRSGVTYFLSQNDEINGANIVQIQPEFVQFSLKNSIFELFL